MTAEDFLDSNVLLYQLDTRDPHKHAVADGIVGQAIARRNACISLQVVQECLNVALRKAEVRLDAQAAQAWFETVLAPLATVQPDIDMVRRALALQQRWQFGFYDALIVAAALQAGCKRLLTEDMQDGQRIETLRIVNPFARRGA